MLKQSPSRNQRPKGFKVKHVLQICVLLAICIWLLYQVKHSNDKKAEYEDSSSEISRKIQNGRDEIITLGRRDLRPLVKDTSFDAKKREGKEEDSEDGPGGGDDQIDGHDQERAEEEEAEGVEDLIDEEDRERDEGSEEEDKGIDFEDVNVLEDQPQDEEEGKTHIRGAREEHHKDDDASGSVMRNTESIVGSLRKVQEKETESENDFEVGKETEKNHTEDFVVGMKDSETKMHYNFRAQSYGSENDFASSRLDNAIYSTLLVKAEANEQSKVENNSAMLLAKGPTSLNGTSKLRELIHDLNPTSNEREAYLQRHSYSTLSVVDNFDAAQKGKEVLDGPHSIPSQGTLQFDGTDKSTDENAVSSGESKNQWGVAIA
ncbi:hypothetical protein L484_025507 [Morus notabilis]|uniref:Uncharacterized protein n=1 Tax=Morus notabilis TaxID=981085 RepID=W9RNQ3_9ROSA|nr:uncharacterized protein LOC21408203 [Morus notabilis]EXC01134.1 hypothetical protein L484_025507 [Morus notabilis]